MHGPGRLLAGKIDEWAEMRLRKGKNKVAGFGGAAIGIENLHQERLDDIKKKEGTEDILETVRKLQKQGLGTVGYYMIGFEERHQRVSQRGHTEASLAQAGYNSDLRLNPPAPDAPLERDRGEIRYLGSRLSQLRWQAHGLESPHLKPEEIPGILDWSFKQVYPWSAPISTSARVWGNAYRYAAWWDSKRWRLTFPGPTRFDWSQGPRLLKVS